jgi:hypothetical protein
MALDWYLKKFKQIYPSGPPLTDVFQVYQRALSEFSEVEIDVACEKALKRCKYFPTPAELVDLCKHHEGFVITTEKATGPPMTEEERADFAKQMGDLATRLNVKPKPKERPAARPCQPTNPSANYIAMAGSLPLPEWALHQSLSDSVPRSRYEIELIKGARRRQKASR